MTIPPTLAPPTTGALGHGFIALARPARYAGEIERQLATAFPRATAVTFGTGRAALASAIGAAMKATGRRTAVLPAFTSYSVAAAAAVAGARVRLCDLDPHSLDFDPADLRSCVDEDTAVVVLGNLFGYPASDAEVAWIRERGALVIDDAAQALGARGPTGPVGWRGDLGVLSFGRGKCATTGDGGVLLVHDESLERFVARPPHERARRGLREWLSAAAVRACARPVVFAGVSRLPGAGIGESRYEPRFDVTPASASAHGLAIDLAEAITRQLEDRTRVARMWLRTLAEGSEVEVIAPREDTTPAFLRLPVLTPGPAARHRILRDLAAQGFRYVRSYPGPLSGVEEFHRLHCEARPTPGAEHIASTLIALPCHAGIRPTDVRRASAILRGDGERELRGADQTAADHTAASFEAR